MVKKETKNSESTQTDKLPNKLMSRSIQTSMNLLDIQNEETQTNDNHTSNNSGIVPVIVEHTLSESNDENICKQDNKNEDIIEAKSLSSASTDSEVFKTPNQSPLPERKTLEEISPEIDKINKSDGKEKPSDSDKKHPKLSFLAVIALKRKIARHRNKNKRKLSLEDENKNAEGKNKSSKANKAKEIIPEVSDKPESADIEGKKYLQNFYLENETSFNVGNITYLPETDILDVDEIKHDISIQDKKLSFDIINEPVAPENTYMHAHRELAKRRQSEVFREKRKKALTYCKKFVAFLFSHIGLCSLMVAYAILGGTIFKASEGPFEIQTKVRVNNEREKTKNQILELATEMLLNKKSRNDTGNEIDKLLHSFQTEVYIATDLHGFNNGGQDELETEEQWSFASSLLFAITVMTTIGKFNSLFSI